MNATATFDLARPDGRGRNGLPIGWGVSLLVHAALVAWLLHAPAPRVPAAAPRQRIEVRLATPPPPPASSTTRAEPATPSAPAIPAAAGAAPSSAPHARARRAPVPVPVPVPAYATRPAPAHETPDTNPQPSTPAPVAPDDATASGTAADGSSTPRVDIASARQAARLIAREQGKSLVALPARKPVVDPNADRAKPVDPIEAARKGDCKTAYAGAGLLAIIPLAASAVMDTGCKW